MSQKQKAESQKQDDEVLNPHLNPELAGKFKVVHTHCRYLQNTCVGDVDLTTLTEEQAAKLADDENQPYFERVV